MATEDDDLSALRSAALASLSAKPKQTKKEDDDLEALRLAALMTRKQNQKIQVIYQQPLQQQIPQFQPPPPIFPNVRPPWIPMQRPHGPPWVVQRPTWRGPLPTLSTNLISLTPEPNAGIPRPRQRFTRPPNYRARGPRPPIVTTKKNTEPATVENKVPDKFSRYNSDSSSDDEDDTDKKKAAQSDDDNHSDAESVTSKKSFSSVSDVAEADEEDAKSEEEAANKEDAAEEDEDAADEAVSGSESNSEQDSEIENNDDDNISIIDDEEDDILAAIDDYLEDRPAKPKVTKAKETEVKKDEKPVEKPKTITKKKRDSVDKNQKTVTKRKPSVTQKASSSKEKPTTPKPDSIKATRQQPSTDPQVPKVDSSREISNQKPQHRNRESQKSDTAKPRNVPSQRDRNSGRSEPRQETHSRRGGFPPQYKQERGRPPQRLVLPPSTPPRQRRDSDLDSVGTSDLSFLSSDSDDERKKLSAENQQPGRVRTRSMSRERRKQGQQSTSGKRDERKTGQSRKPTQPTQDEQTTKAAPPKERVDARRRLGQKDAGGDLRKKLESKGVSKVPVDADPETDSQKISERGGKIKTARSANNNDTAQPTTRGLSPVRKTGVINLKKKSSRFPVAKKSKSRSREVSPEISLPDLSEARRIVITRPNTASSSKATVKLEQAESRPKSKAKLDSKNASIVEDKPKRRLSSDQRTQKGTIRKKAEETVPVNRKRTVLPPKTTVTEKKLKKTTREKVVEKPPEPVTSSNEEGEDSGSEDEEDSSSSEEEIIDEVFAIDDSALPAYDDVLGNFDEEDEGEYYDGGAKSRKKSQSSSKKRKRSEKKKHRPQSRKPVPDSRRIVPKSSPERVSGEEVEDRKSAKNAQPKKKTIHERLGLLAGSAVRKEKSPPKQSSRSRRWSGSSGESSRASLRWSADEFEVEPRLEINSGKGFSKKQHSFKKSGTSSVQVVTRKETPVEASPREKDSKKRKRRIMVAGRREVEQSTSVDPKAKRAVKKSRGPNVRDRLGKVILTSVLSQSPPDRGRERAVENAGGESTKVREKVKRNRKERDRSKSGSKRGKREDVLEAKIRRIKEQNGQILKRQKEIAMEKERFG